MVLPIIEPIIKDKIEIGIIYALGILGKRSSSFKTKLSSKTPSIIDRYIIIFFILFL